MARCPNYGWKESQEYARAEELKEKIAGIESKAKKAPQDTSTLYSYTPTHHSRIGSTQIFCPAP